MSRLGIVIRWTCINTVCMAASFLTAGLLVAIYPSGMIILFSKWADLLSTFGARSASEFSSLTDMFFHILQQIMTT